MADSKKKNNSDGKAIKNIENENVNLHSGHRERMRKRFLETNLVGFSDHQIIELLLFYAYPRRDTNELAHKIMNYFKTIDNVFDASVEELRYAGVSENAAVLFRLIPNTATIYYKAQRMQRKKYSSSRDIQLLFAPLFVGLDHEEFKLACLDSDYSLIDIINISDGGRNYTSSNLRKILEETMRHKSPYVALAHNHPHVSTAASHEDIVMTQKIKHILFDINVTLMDHIIVDKCGAYSMITKTMVFHDSERADEEQYQGERDY